MRSHGAERYVHVEFYIMALDQHPAPFFDALEAAVKRGIVVRVLLDHLASRRSPGYFRTIRRLKQIGRAVAAHAAGATAARQVPAPDLRNHRKILVVDGVRRLHRVAEHHRLQLQQVSNAGADCIGKT